MNKRAEKGVMDVKTSNIFFAAEAVVDEVALDLVPTQIAAIDSLLLLRIQLVLTFRPELPREKFLLGRMANERVEILDQKVVARYGGCGVAIIRVQAAVDDHHGSVLPLDID